MSEQAIHEWLQNNLTPTLILLAIGTALSTVLSGVSLWRQVKQERNVYRPAFTVDKHSLRSDGFSSTTINVGNLRFVNTGIGTASSVGGQIWVHQPINPWWPRFQIQRFSRAEDFKVDEGIYLGLGDAVKSQQCPDGSLLCTQLHEFELFLHYRSALGIKYLTFLSVGLGGVIKERVYGVRDTFFRRCTARVGVLRRYYVDHVPIWIRVRRAKRNQ